MHVASVHMETLARGLNSHVRDRFGLSQILVVGLEPEYEVFIFQFDILMYIFEKGKKVCSKTRVPNPWAPDQYGSWSVRNQAGEKAVNSR